MFQLIELNILPLVQPNKLLFLFFWQVSSCPLLTCDVRVVKHHLIPVM